MASDKIKSSDIFDDKLFDKVKGDAKAFQETLVALKGEFEVILKQQRDFLSKKQNANEASSINKKTQAIERSKNARMGLSAVQRQLNQLQDEEVKGKIRFNQANKRQKQELTDLIALENKQGETLNTLLARNRKLRRERAELNIKTAEGRKRISEINVQLDKNNKLIRQNSDALKKQRLNVGNYTSAIGGAVRKLKNLAGAFGLVAGAAGLVSIFRDAIGTIRDFEQVQTDLASILQKSRLETENLSKAAQDLGATTFFTATEVSKLQVELAKLGFDTQQIIDSEEAILDLAAAFSIDLPQAAKVVASTLNGFQLDASESGRVADVLAKSFANSALDIEKFEVAISKVAPIAKGLNIDIETTTATLGQLVNAGFDASTAGTQFRNILLKLSNPASELANTLGFTVANSDDLIESFKTLNKEQLTVAEAQGLIDVRSVALLKSLSDNADGVQKLRGELEDAGGTAKDIASNQLKTLNGSFRLLSSAYEGFILSLDSGNGAISEFLKNITQVITGVFNLLTNTEKTIGSFRALKPEVQELSIKIVEFFKAVKNTVTTLFEYRRAIIAAFVALKSYQAILVATTLATNLYRKATILARFASIQFNSTVGIGTKVMKAFNLAVKSNPLGLLASVLATVGAVLVTFLADWILFGDTTEDINKNLENNVDLLTGLEDRIKKIRKELNDFAKIRSVFEDVLKGSAEALIKASDPELSASLNDANSRLANAVRKVRVENISLAKVLDGDVRAATELRLKKAQEEEAVIRKIIGAIEDEQKIRKEGLDGSKEETGILNNLRAELKKVREARDLDLNEGDIEANNKRIKTLQDEIKRLEELGLASDKLAKIRSKLDKLLIKSAADIDSAFSDIDAAEFSAEIRTIEDELESVGNKFKALDETLSDDSSFFDSKGRGFFYRRTVISKQELESLLEDSKLFTEEQKRLIDDRTKKELEALNNQARAEERAAFERKKLRDANLDIEEERIKNLEGVTEASRKAELDKINKLRLESDIQFQAEQSAIAKEYREDEAKLNKKAEDEKTSLTITGEEQRKKVRNKYFDIKKQELLDEIKLYGDFVNKIIDLTAQKVAKQNRLEEERISRDVAVREKQSDRQFELAKKGLDNTYAYQESKAIQARSKQFNEERENRRKENALRLTSIYFASLEARLSEAAANANQAKQTNKPVNKNDVTAANAPFFALKDTFLAEGLSSLVAGAFATGVENFQGKGTGTSDSNLIAFSHGESVVTAKGTAENAGLTTAMNNGTVDDYFAKVWMPKFNMDNSSSSIGKSVYKDNTSKLLLDEIKALRLEQASRPVQQVHVDSFGNIIETSYKNGLKTVLNHQIRKPL